MADQYSTQGSDCTYFSPAEQEKNVVDLEELQIASKAVDTSENVSNCKFDKNIFPTSMDIDCQDTVSKDMPNRFHAVSKTIENPTLVTETANKSQKCQTEQNKTIFLCQSQTKQQIDETKNEKTNDNKVNKTGNGCAMDEYLLNNKMASDEIVQESSPIVTPPTITLEQFKYLLNNDTNVEHIWNEIEPEKEEEEEERVVVKNSITITDIDYVRNKLDDEYQTVTDEEWMKMDGRELFKNIPDTKFESKI